MELCVSEEYRDTGMKVIWAGIFLATIVAANYAISRWGIVPIGLGLTAPAGVYFAGFAFVARDQLREATKLPHVLGLILLGALLSWWIEDVGRIALASGIAFGVSELADTAVYEPLRKRWAIAVAGSNAVGLVVDSALFLWIAFGSLDYIEGQIVGKAMVTLVAIGCLAIWKGR